MNEFKDRDVQYPNRKKLKIKDITFDENGDIKELLVEEIRSEGVIYNTGTPLKSNALEEVITNMINSKVKAALENYHENGLAELETTEITFSIDGSCENNKNISIDVSEEVNIVTENMYGEYFNVSAPDDSPAGTITVSVTELQEPDTSGASEFNFVVKLYSQETDELIKKVTCNVVFQVPSLTPED